MRDKRPVDELSIEELEIVIALRKREAHLERLRRYQDRGRVLDYPADGPMIQPPPVLLAVSEPEDEPIATRAIDCPQLPESEFADVPTFEDELDVDAAHRKQAAGSQRWRPLGFTGSRVLVLIEIAAALGMIYLIVAMYQSLTNLTQTTARVEAEYNATAKAQLIVPTATPLISVSAVVLPEGHTVKVDEKGVVSASFNWDEVPAQFREQYRTQLSQTVVPPTPSVQAPVRIRIARIKVDSAVVEGDDWESLKLGVGHHLGTGNPGQAGNMVFAAHNDVFGETFRDLDQLRPGDPIMVSTTTRDYTYIVKTTQIVKPNDVWVMDSRDNTKQVTLISCYPYRVDNMRIVVFATLQES